MLIWNVVENSKSRRSSLKLDYARKTSKESDFEKSFVKSFGFYSAQKNIKNIDKIYRDIFSMYGEFIQKSKNSRDTIYLYFS